VNSKRTTHTKTHYNQTFERQREILKSSKRDSTHHIQGILKCYQISHQKCGVPNRVCLHIQNAEIILLTMNLISGQNVLLKWVEN
jgi:hypothetical protein